MITKPKKPEVKTSSEQLLDAPTQHSLQKSTPAVAPNNDTYVIPEDNEEDNIHSPIDVPVSQKKEENIGQGAQGGFLSRVNKLNQESGKNIS